MMLALLSSGLLYGGSIALDLGSTVWAEKRGAVEANPLMRTWPRRLFGAAATTMLLCVVDHELKVGRRPGLRRALRIIVPVFCGGVAVRNIAVGRRAAVLRLGGG